MPPSKFAVRSQLLQGTLLTTDTFVNRRLWIGPALAVLVIALVGWWAHRSVEQAVKTNLASQLSTLLDADVAALEIWLAEQKADVESLADDNRVRRPVMDLIERSQESGPNSVAVTLLTSPALNDLRNHLRLWLDSQQAEGFVVIAPNGMVIAHDRDMGIGDLIVAKSFQQTLGPVFQGESTFVTPLESLIAIKDASGVPRAGVPVMFQAAPIFSDDGKPIAAFCLRVRPEAEFTEILSVARAGATGETYAFNSAGVMITNSRFDEDLKEIGLLSDTETTHSILNVRIRDPGVDMTRGLRPTVRRPDQPFTRMAAAAIAGDVGVDVNGYRDYRGVPVVGAWTWLPEYEIGVATEVDVAEAFRPLYALRMAFAVLAGLLLATTAGLFGLTFYATKMATKARRATLNARRLGQYALDEKIGSGGMGEVYRAHHDMLHRPTAVKLLQVERTNEQAIARFEREVQLTSRLTHPNTIAIYDYGRTPDGVFYYAMEFLDGITLDQMVSRFGPMPASRVIFILRQLCGSLSEAHSMELIHRDVKPANIMLTRRGGMCDFVKLLDFGLVKPQESEQTLTQVGAITGTPLFLSPEAIQNEKLDGRSDLYAVGAVGYFMLTGETVFSGPSLVAICAQHVQAKPVPPSERLGKPIDNDLQDLIMSCLAKRVEDRPASADVLDELLSHCQADGEWTRSDAERWWRDSLGSEREASPVVDDANQTKNGEALTETIAISPKNAP